MQIQLFAFSESSILDSSLDISCVTNTWFSSYVSILLSSLLIIKLIIRFFNLSLTYKELILFSNCHSLE